MKTNLIRFDIALGKSKPENILHRENPCPFCDRTHLENIIAEEDGMILLRNKYNVLEDADQFVLIEGSSCDSDMPDYTPEHMHHLIRFGVKHWLAMRASGQYSAVIFFKNHGSLSGGTMRHPHMQLVGFKKVNDALTAEPGSFTGIPIASSNGVTLSAATQPRVGFGEFNITTTDNTALDTIANYIQSTVAYIKKRFPKSRDSYNIFFYWLNGYIAVKLMPRFPTSPLFIGYDIRILPSNMQELADEMKQLYFTKKAE